MSGDMVPSPVVLVVDDEPLIRWALSEGLADLGYAVRQAGSALETRAMLATLDRRAPLVIVLDLRLPDMKDLSLLREIRSTRPEAAVIMITAHGTEQDAREAAALGVRRSLGKPFDVMSVVHSVDAACRQAAQA